MITKLFAPIINFEIKIDQNGFTLNPGNTLYTLFLNIFKNFITI